MMDKADREQILRSGAIGLFEISDTPASQRAAREMLDFMDTVWRLDVDPDVGPATVWGLGRNDAIRN